MFLKYTQNVILKGENGINIVYHTVQLTDMWACLHMTVKRNTINTVLLNFMFYECIYVCIQAYSYYYDFPTQVGFNYIPTENTITILKRTLLLNLKYESLFYNWGLYYQLLVVQKKTWMVLLVEPRSGSDFFKKNLKLFNNSGSLLKVYKLCYNLLFSEFISI